MTQPTESRKKLSKELADIDGELCGICQACASVCPVNAIDVLESYVQVVLERCTGCGTCVKVCPVAAINLVKR